MTAAAKSTLVLLLLLLLLQLLPNARACCCCRCPLLLLVSSCVAMTVLLPSVSWRLPVTSRGPSPRLLLIASLHTMLVLPAAEQRDDCDVPDREAHGGAATPQERVTTRT